MAASKKQTLTKTAAPTAAPMAARAATQVSAKASAKPTARTSAKQAAPAKRSEAATEKQIQVRAYLLWEMAGKPGCRELDFWLQAEKELGSK